MKDKSQIIFTKSHVLMFLALISCFLWGSAFPSVKAGYGLFNIGAGDTYEKIVFAGYRFFISSIMIFVFCMVTGRSLKLKKSHIPQLAFLGLMQTSIQYFFFYIGLSNVSGTIGSILAATNTFFSVIIAHFFFKEDRLSFRKILGVLLGFTGVVIANMNGGSIKGNFNITGEGFILISSLIGALAGIYTKRLTKEISPFVITGYQLFIGSLLLIFIGFSGGGQNINFTPKGLILLLYLGFISAAAFSIWSLLLKYNGVGKVTIYKFTIPIFGMTLSYFFLGERFLGFYVIMSALLVAGGIILINLKPEARV